MDADRWVPSPDISGEILNAIRQSKDIEPFLQAVPDRFRFQIRSIERRYQGEAQRLDAAAGPRNRPFYNMIQEHYDDFRLVDAGDQMQVETYWKGKKHSLLTYLLQIIPSEEIAATAELSAHSGGLVGTRAVREFIADLKELGAVGFARGDVGRIARWLDAVASGQAFTIVSPVCPDYSADPIDGRRFRFTFRALGTGCGLSGTRILEVIDQIHALVGRFAGDVGPPHRFLVGDFEALDEATTARLGLTVEEFLARNRRSCDALEERSTRPITAGLFTDHCGGLEGWSARYRDTVAVLMKRFLGDGQVPSAELVAIAKARLPLYRRWLASPDLDLEAALPIVIRQGAEYSLMAQIIKESFENPLILGADHHKMSYFYKLVEGIPVVYLDRNYE
jgi:hypothetical protein